MSRLHFGASLPQVGVSWPDVLEAAIRLETQGFDSLWVSDHMQLPYGGAPDTPLFEAFAQLAGVAAVTQRAELGTNCANVMFRNPSVMAKQITTIDHIASGRIVAGIGAGYVTSEFIAYGCPPWRQRERVRALAEAIGVIRSLLTGKVTTFDGEYFRVRDAVCQPTPVRVPPLLIGGAGGTTLRAAAKHADIWNNPPMYEARFAANLERLRGFASEVGRDPDGLTASMRARIVLLASQEEAERYLATLRGVLGDAAVDSIVSNGIWGGPSRVCEGIERFRRMGCEHFVIDFYAPDRREAEELFARDVTPSFH